MTSTTHKLVNYPNLPEFTEVFDLTTDPYEIKNFASDTVLTAKLDAELKQLMKTVNHTPPPDANKARQPDPTKPAEKAKSNAKPGA
jgi:hypothetical protein